MTHTPPRPASCLPASCFCEAVRPSLVRQPVNTGTSLAFVVAALVVLGAHARATRDRRRENLLLSAPMYTWLFAFALLVIGVGSAFFHASLTFAGQTADVAGMYLLATSLLLYNVARRRSIAESHAALLYFAVNAMLIGMLVLAPAFRRYVFALLIVTAIALEVRARGVQQRRSDVRLFVGALAAIAIGFAFWIADITGLLCAPGSIWQGHGVWHLCGAASAVLVYRHLLSESLTPGPD
jgi:Ceramidase